MSYEIQVKPVFCSSVIGAYSFCIQTTGFIAPTQMYV